MPSDGESGPARRFARTAQPQRSTPRNTTPDPALVQPLRTSTEGMRRVGIRPAGTEGSYTPGDTGNSLSASAYAVGERAEHPPFGAGTVERIETLATARNLEVRLDRAGAKAPLEKYAKLTKL